jgi:hypothetical protein
MKKEFKVNEVVYYIKDGKIAVGQIHEKIQDQYYLFGKHFGMTANQLFKTEQEAYDFMYKKTGKKVLVQEIVDYIFNKYTEDERVKALVRRYEKIETHNSRRRDRDKERLNTALDTTPTYLVTKPARDVLEPLIDAEYFKVLNYRECPNDQLDAIVMGMSQLETRIYRELKEKIKE